MCDIIEMPDGSEFRSIDNDECLCCNTQDEIFSFISSKLGKVEFGERIVFERDCFGWTVKKEKFEW